MVSGHVHVAVVVQVIRDKSHLPDESCNEHVGLGICCVGEGLSKIVSVRCNQLIGKRLICLTAGISDCSTVRSVITAPV